MFRNIFKSKKTESQLISVIEYPNNYVFETYFKLETGLWRRSDFVTITDRDIDQLYMNDLILKHLDYSKNIKENQIDFKKLNENYKKITGLSSIKKQMKNSKCVQISRKTNEIIFTPSRNGGTKGDKKGYSDIFEKKIVIEKNTENLSHYLLQCFEACE